ncbi:MAG: hypothetical protein HY788_17600 [Deltaproteobacteria bacterium]|nr:hypothetical protein [Deltaproteobacteria bacterium]
MDDKEIDAYISKRIRDLELNLYDFTCGRVDMASVLTEGEYRAHDPYRNLGVPLRDLIRYWWNNLVDQDCVIDNVLDDILTEYKDRMLPKEEVREPVDTYNALEGILKSV